MLEYYIEVADELTHDFGKLRLFIKAYVTYLYHNGFVGDAEALSAIDKIDAGEGPTDVLKELMQYVEAEA